MSTRLTPESLETIRREAAPRSVSVRLLLAELDAVTAERDSLQVAFTEGREHARGLLRQYEAMSEAWKVGRVPVPDGPKGWPATRAVEIAVSAFQSSQSAVLQRVKNGERIALTQRGYPVAVLCPVLRSSDSAASNEGGKPEAGDVTCTHCGSTGAYVGDCDCNDG